MSKTIKRVLGVEVNHVFVVNFPKFRRAVDEMGCVYMTVDAATTTSTNQAVNSTSKSTCSPATSACAAGRRWNSWPTVTKDTSLTRDARDQRFLLEVKAQYGATLLENREKFERILGRAVETDLHGTGEVLDLLKLLVQSAGKASAAGPFPGEPAANLRHRHANSRSTNRCSRS